MVQLVPMGKFIGSDSMGAITGHGSMTVALIGQSWVIRQSDDIGMHDGEYIPMASRSICATRGGG